MTQTIATQRSVAAAPPCPACASRAGDETGTVPVADQHREYTQHCDAHTQALDACFGPEPASYVLWRCRDCGLEHAFPAHAPSVDWYATLYRALNLYPASRWEYTVVARLLNPEQVLVDYGCGSGNFLRTVQGTVRRAVGFDFSPAVVAQAQSQGTDARVLTSAVPALQADHVVAFHVLEHLSDPMSLFRFARAAGRPAVKLWVAVPSDRRATRLYGEIDSLDLPPHHLTRWTGAALQRVGQAAGWQMSELLYEPIGTRLRVWEATRRTALYARIPATNRLIYRLARRGLAAAVWARGAHPMQRASGFSMLACFTSLEHS